LTTLLFITLFFSKFVILFTFSELPSGKAQYLLVLISWYQLLFILTPSFTWVTKQAILMRRSTVLIIPLQVVFPGIGFC